ncbi:hypothetical protein OAX78_03525 [Planctomycetota bacterium]|nr:hypothetical protein [Planctomycetota bacterium]
MDKTTKKTTPPAAKTTLPGVSAEYREQLERSQAIACSAATAVLDASSAIGANVDKLIKAQVGYMTSASKDSTDFVGAAVESSLAAGEAWRQASVDLFEQSTSAFRS